MSQLTSLIGLQLLSRAFTFLLNQGLFRLASPGAFGTAAIQFELFSSTILFLSREGVRNALLRVKRSQDGSWKAGNLSFLPLCIGLPLALATSIGYARFAAEETRSQSGFYGGISVYAVAAIIELWCEPMHNQAMSESKTHVRVRAEGMGVVFKTLSTFLVLLYDSRANMNGALALMAFAAGQLSYSLCLMLVYLSEYGFSALFPSSTVSAVDQEISWLSWTMTSQSVIKHFLTEGDKFVLGAFSPLSDQGGYAIAVNYGSLIARIIFQPIEETSRISFSRTLAPPASREALSTASQTLLTLLSVQTSFSIILLVFGPAYLPVLLPMLLPRQYLATSAPRVLSAWVWYIPVLALNGGLEAFISSVSTPRDLNRQSWWMAVFSVIYIGAAVQLYNMQLGDPSLVYANIINLSARIAYAVYFVSIYFTNNNARASLTWSQALPHWKLTLACLISWAVVGQSERRLDVLGTVVRAGAGFSVLLNKNVLLHVGLGGVMGCVCLATWWITDGPRLIAQWRGRVKKD
ncbi:Rft protein-domain-containing protein [Roridomyces roridus]|uniref:Man(5)GlcNAc(2)-PP-dolichol translocation protein RFT1 n=1 Tax=Roridomyces roridus TaxID=1738132 RepID=A0AAD7FC44_9AGAR|nr:Rft protein-domain-containing protein [Roridomyces roridus]